MRRALLRVELHPGYFSRERWASFPAGGWTHTVIAPDHCFIDGKLEVTVVEETAYHAMIDLPGDTFLGDRVIIPRSLLSEKGVSSHGK